MFRLALLNPNTDERHTDAMRDVALATLPQGSEVTAVTAERGPASIESAVDSAAAAAEVVALMRSLEPHDAYVIACFGDPGLDAARELTDRPVVGIGEAGCTAAALVARRFVVITTLARGVPELEDAIGRRGLRSRCAGVVPLDIPVAEQGSGHSSTTAAIVETGRRAVHELHADALVLACGGMADVAATVQEQVGVPVCEGVSFGSLLAYGLWRCGLGTSKAGAYGWPEPIPYVT
jgi:allantoin racemase